MVAEDILVLFVSEDEEFQRAFEMRLAKMGILSEQAAKGEAWLSILEKKPVHVVVLDFTIPGMNGMELLRQIKEKHPRTQVILLIGHSCSQDGIEGIKSGAFDYLTKPLEMEHLLSKIEQAREKFRREEEKRRQAESEYQLLLQSVTDYVIAINRNYQIIVANNHFKKEFGNHHNSHCYKAWKMRDEKCEQCPVEKSFKDGQSHSNEESVVMKDGRTAQMLVKATPVTTEGGKIAYVLETATDITEKRRLQKELNRVSDNVEGLLNERLRDLEKSEERYRTIFERSLDAILHTDPMGRIMEINPAGLHILGFRTKDELLSLGPAMDLFENREDFYRIQKILFREGFVKEFETRLRGKGGRSFDAIIASSVIFDIIGQISGHVMIIRDVTERKKAQEQVRRQNARLATLNAVSLTVSSSLELKEVLSNTIDEMLEILGPDSVRIYLLDDKREILHLAAHRGLSQEFIRKEHIVSRRVGEGILGQTVLARETRIIDNALRSDHPYMDTIVEAGFRTTLYVPLVLKGESVGVMCVSRRSEFKFLEDYVDFLTAIGNQIGVAVHNAILYEEANRAYLELKEAQEQVIRAEKLASLGKLSATIAHEINNPLAAVLNYTRLMMKLIARGRFTPERLKDISKYLGTMESETARCGEVVKNLLAFSRQSGTNIKAHSIEKIIDRALILIAHDLEIKEILVRKEIELHLPEARCDLRQIQQALMNLMSNASEAMTGGGTLIVAAVRSEKNGFLEIKVSDTGCGIPEEEVKSIFEPFFTTKEEGKGVGLGLSVVFGIMANHNGFVEVESKVGKGSTFKICLPAV